MGLLILHGYPSTEAIFCRIIAGHPHRVNSPWAAVNCTVKNDDDGFD